MRYLNKYKKVARKLVLTGAMLLTFGVLMSAPRERLLMNFNWQFAYGHATDIEQDFNVGTRYFTYLAKAGYGDGAASEGFDDRTWRTLDLPHDWAVEQGFSGDASHSHGYKTVGFAYPESSVGWYRKTFDVPAEDEGKRIFIEFDGVYRDAKVWVNGFYCGNEPSGYSSFAFDITEYLNFGGENVIAVRADASIEEGWFYEGAGIYRHVWLTKTATTHVPQYGTFITSEVEGDKAVVTARINVTNKAIESSAFQVRNTIVNPQGEVVASQTSEGYLLAPMHTQEYTMAMTVEHPLLWDLDTPHLYEVKTEIVRDEEVLDRYSTTFGIRTIEWTADKGFFLNGRHVKIKGTNNHQNHAGVGTAIPDALHEWRLQQLKDMGNNAYRTAHYPPTPALLEAADRMGMLILNENRLMGTTDEILDHLRRLMVRDRNHPSVVLWSIGNEEWQIEGNERGAKMAAYMQAYAKKYDTTRPINAAVSGTWGGGISSVVEVMGYNYLRHGSTDAHHSKFPWQASLGTEEGSTNTTRGIYVDDEEKQYLTAYDRDTPSGFFSIQHGWKHYASRDYLSGMVIWTGFDYRGESTPFVYPSVVSYFGMFDLCGLPKDNVYYLKSWWSQSDVLHILPHWNWPDRAGEEIDVWVYSNMDEVELFLNSKSLGRQKKEPNSHLSWKVKYVPGTVKAVGYKNGRVEMQSSVATTDKPAAVNMVADRTSIKGDHEDVSVITVQVEDKKGRIVPDANLDVTFSITGPGRIIGVGNGNPTSHEADRFFETVTAVPSTDWKEMDLSKVDLQEVVQPGYDDAAWQAAFADGALLPGSESMTRVFRGVFELTGDQLQGEIHWMYRSIGSDQSVYVNGHLVGEQLDGREHTLLLSGDYLKDGANEVVIVTQPFVMAHPWDEVNMDSGALKVEIPSEQWRRKTFNGLAQVLVQSTGEAGVIEVKATSPGLKDGRLSIKTDSSERRAHIK
jgi:beta-galactosidase